MRPEDRLSYAAPFDHPQRSAPGGAAVIVWPVVNVENWLIDNPMPRQVLVAPTGAVLKPDVANWGWHEYGMRVGFWRLHDAFARRGLKPTLSINGSVCDAYPRLAGAAHDSGWEFMGHGFVQVPTHLVEDQRRMIADTVERIRTFTGRPCEGWLGPGLTETLETPDLLAEAGVRYVADWVVDDTPCRLPTRAGDLVTMPYTLELNDIAINMIQYHPHDELRLRAQRTVDRLAREARASGRPKVMCFAVHCYITGVPHRIDSFEAMLDSLMARDDVIFMQGRDILRWHLETGSV
jgi:peptidoglycan/xylan/chitin deacetylase (PgdA/CDA1 family)